MPIKPEELRFAALAVDIVCFRVRDQRLELLLGQVVSSGNAFQGRWAHTGGLVKVRETAEESAARLLRDKAGLDAPFFEQLATFSRVDRDPRGRVVSVAYLALVEPETEGGGSIVPTRWVPVRELPKLAYDHDELTAVALERLRAKLGYTNVARYLLPREFTLTELQAVYETALGRALDKRNFRKKILGIGIVAPTGKTRRKGKMRPAALYRFAGKAQKIIEIL
jgi:8-oxo-dGTP diphosphatase